MWFMGELPRNLGFLQDLLPSPCHSVLPDLEEAFCNSKIPRFLCEPV